MAKKQDKNVGSTVVGEVPATPLALDVREPAEVTAKKAGRPKGSKNAPKTAKGIQASVKVSGANELIVTTSGGIATYATPSGEVAPSLYFEGGYITADIAKNVLATVEGLPVWKGDPDQFLTAFTGLNASSIALVVNWANSVK